MASRIGRIFRNLVVVWAVLVMVLPASGVWAAPYAAVVIDARSGETLYEKNADARLHPASLTKMMTLYIAFEELRAGRITLDTRVTITKHAAAQPPSRLGLKPGQKIALRYLIRAAAVKSANDAATAIGEAISGSEAEFAKRMTRTARALGMSNTTFKNANGLTAKGHLSSARDMSTLGRRLFYDFPEYYNIFSRRTADAGVATVHSTNARFLDSYKGADGIKTGYTVPAGFNLVGSAERGNKRIIAAIFGGTSTAQRNAKMAELLDLGFGKAPANAKVQKPNAPAYTGDELIASNATGVDEDLPADAPGGSAKTVRVSGEVRSSLRPKARPGVEPVPEAVAVALAEGIEGALAEATAPPPPEGTLEAQALTLTNPEAPVEDTAVAVTDLPENPINPETEVAALEPETVAPPAPGTLDAQAVALADPAPGTLDAQAVALADPAPGTLEPQAVALADPTVIPGTLDAQAAALAAPAPEAPADAGVTDPATMLAASLMPRARPVAAEPEIRVAEAPAEIAPEVPADPQADAEAELALAALGASTAEDLSAGTPTGTVTGVQSVSGSGAVLPQQERLAAFMPSEPPRRAPIFDAEAKAAPAPEEQEVVVAISTSGASQWGVSVGGYTSHADAEKALFKLALAESATLNVGLRRVIQTNDGYAANFLGLSEDQADLACRRLSARAIPCETVSP